MIIHRERKKQQGMNIVEVVMAMALLMVAMMSLAFVYPKGRTLTDSGRMSMQATEIARSIMEEIKLRPIRSTVDVWPNAANRSVANIGMLPMQNDPASTIAPCIANIARDQMLALQWPFHHFTSNNEAEWRERCPVMCWEDTPQNVREIQEALARGVTEPKKFFLPSQELTFPDNEGGIINQGIVIQRNADRDANALAIAGGTPLMVGISVTVAWVEQRQGGLRVGHVTLSSFHTTNRY